MNRAHLGMWSGFGFGFLCLGALLGALLATASGPALIAWYFEPPADLGLSCAPAVRWSLGRLAVFQWWGAGLGTLGVVAFMILGWVMKRKVDRRAPPNPTPSG
jgi:hypothetical protein